METAADASSPSAIAEVASTTIVAKSKAYTSHPTAGSRPSARNTTSSTALTAAKIGSSAVTFDAT
ncbi:Uncharacterised protein [Mycobacterium tuberculosis]|nr:Uncharacterised protein [Mycobacterium tuberculosis]